SSHLPRAPIVVGQDKSQVPAAAGAPAGLAGAGEPVRVDDVEDAGSRLRLDVIDVRPVAALDAGFSGCGGRGDRGGHGLACYPVRAAATREAICSLHYHYTS